MSPAPAGEAAAWVREIEIELTLHDQARNRYVPVPFTVPEGMTSLGVQLEVDDPDCADGPALIDLGCDGAAGWRGWSGGARRDFVITADDATPGYLPGPLEGGRWAVVLGVHALPAARATARVHLRSPACSRPDHGPRPSPSPRAVRGSARQLPAPEGRRWLAGDTHCHSLHSDGTRSLWQVAEEGVRSGLDFLCMTDHNTTSHHSWLPEVAAEHGITLVAGQEVTTHRGHANAYGDIGFVDFRQNVDQWARTVAARGGLLSVNHPVSGDCSWLENVPEGVGGVEILHSDLYRDPLSTAAFAWTGRLLAERRALGHPVLSMLAGADFHSPDVPVRPGTPTTWVCAEDDTPEAILHAMKEGRTALTASYHLDEDGAGRPRVLDGPIVLRSDEQTLHVRDARGHMLVDGGGRRRVIEHEVENVRAPRFAGPYRLETADRRTVALSA